MIGILREGKLYLYDDIQAFYDDKSAIKNHFIHFGSFIEVHNRSRFEVIV